MINDNYFETFKRGLTAQIRELSLDETLSYLRNHLQNFLLCDLSTFNFLERLANDPETDRHAGASAALRYLLGKALQMRPLRPGLLAAVEKITGDPSIGARRKLIDKLNESGEVYDAISAISPRDEDEKARALITQLIEAHPTHAAAAQLALNYDRLFGRLPGPWSRTFRCHLSLKGIWDTALFNHCAAMGAYDEAMKIWTRLKPDRLGEVSLNYAAEMFVAGGDVARGLELYGDSLALDPRQTPIRLRMRELESPFRPAPSLVDSIPVNICLYSWNKAEMLGQTLEGLSRSDIGRARIDVLLNGCTDDSLAVVEKARELFPDNEFHIHNLHVNIGAPAARNWLMFLPEVQRAKYIAFLDDDVTVQKDWLAHFLTIAEADDRVGVVGCKVLHPGSPALTQYLFRYVAIASHDLLTLCLDSPILHFDNHGYDFVRETRNVMGCQHLLRTDAINDVPAGFDIRFSPSQVDDIDHDLCLCLKGWKVMYTGLVTCIHHQCSGTNALKPQKRTMAQIGGIMGNDLKFYFKHADHLDEIGKLDNLSLDLGCEQPPF